MPYLAILTNGVSLESVSCDDTKVGPASFQSLV